MALIFCILCSSFIFLLFYLRKKFPFTIKVKTIHLQRPVIGYVERKAFVENSENKKLIKLEEESRRSAYKNTSLNTGPAFFDDSDMRSDYFLILVYDKKRNVPLLTARYYFDKDVILKCLEGEEKKGLALNPYLYNGNTLFLSDRLSGNTSNTLYRKHRDYIFLLFYKEIYRQNKSRKFILMARKEPREKLLTKYLRQGLDVIGSNVHKGKAHWILLGDMKKIKRGLRKTFLSTVYLLIKS